MMLLNNVSRFHVAAAAVRGGSLHNPKVSVDEHQLESWFMHEVEKHKRYALAHGTDPDDIYDTPKFS